jgi:thiol-disulfide isomerase/thioredoxin
MITTLARRVAVGFAATLVAALSMTSVAGAQDSGIEVGKAAPAAALQTLDGKPTDLSQFIGKKPVLMEFWATWCPNCRELEPTMKAMHAKYGSKVAFVGIAVSVNQSPALVKRYVENHKLPWTQVYDTKGSATDAYDVPATSYVVLVDKTGKVVYTGVGGNQDIEAILKRVF